MERNSEGVRRREGGRERRRERGMERDINRGGRSNLEPKFTGTEGVRENGGSERRKKQNMPMQEMCSQ